MQLTLEASLSVQDLVVLPSILIPVIHHGRWTVDDILSIGERAVYLIGVTRSTFRSLFASWRVDNNQR